MERRCTLTLALALLLLMPRVAAAQTDERVRFARGESSADLRGEVAGFQRHDFVVRADAGQTLTVRLDAARDTATIDVIAPGDGPGHGAWSMTLWPRSGEWSARLLESGDYRIRVESRVDRPLRFLLRVAVAGASQFPEEVAFRARPAGSYARSGGGDLDVQRLRDGRLRFGISLLWGSEENVHIGDASGVIPLEGHTATYVNERCRLTFRFAGDRVYVTQTGSDADCDFGANVNADGVYARTATVTPARDTRASVTPARP